MSTLFGEKDAVNSEMLEEPKNVDLSINKTRMQSVKC